MSESDNHDLSRVLAEATQQLPFRPDLEDVERRRARMAKRDRLRAGVLGLVVAFVGVGLGIGVLSPLLQKAGERSDVLAAQPGGGPAGRLLVGQESGSAEVSDVVTLGIGTTQSVGDNVVSFEFSPDGSRVLAATLEHETSGLGYSSQLLAIDPQTGDRSVIVQVTSPASVQGPAEWSPDGSLVAYLFAPNRFRNASLLAQDLVPQYALCIVDVSSLSVRCFPEIGTVYSFDWSPAGDRLVLGRPPGEPIQVFDLATGTVSSLASADNPSVAQLLGQKGVSDPGSVQYIEPSWSPSGRFVAATAMAGSTTPVVFSSDGTLVASGHPNPEFRPSSWSPTEDVLAYATGVLGRPTTSSPAVYLLNPVSGEDKLLILTTSEPSPDVLDLVWSPDGRWVAVGNLNLIRIVDADESAPTVTVDPFPQTAPGALIDWEE